MAIELPPDYYLDNFRQLFDFVHGRYSQLLNQRELDYHQRLTGVTRQAQMLYVRLLTRRGELFLAHKLDYPEIGNISTAASALATAGLLDASAKPTAGELLPLYTKPELVLRSGERRWRKLSRAELEQTILQSNEDSAELEQHLRGDDTIYRVLDQQLFITYRLCFFGNLRQDLTDFVLRDLGMQRYETYPLEQEQLLFTSRSQLDDHLRFYQLAEPFEQSLPEDRDSLQQAWQAMPHHKNADPVLARRVERLGNRLARQMERLGDLNAALAIYQEIQRPPARERTARILAQQGDIDSSLQLCREMLDHPRIEEERQFAASFGFRLSRQHNVPWLKPPDCKPPRHDIRLPKTDSVEQAVASYLSNQGQCFYVENALVNGVLGLLIWDIVFAPLRGAFFNPFQVAPADFYEPEFCARRNSRLCRRLTEVSEPESMADILWRHYESKFGIANPLVNWQVLDKALLHAALQHIPPTHWRAMMLRLLADLRHHRNGMPDLVHFPDSGGYQWVEVKGPGDRLQKNQLRWMSFFAEHDMPHQVIDVQWLENKHA